MKTILGTTEVIGLVAQDETELEVCATAEASFDEETSQMEVWLDSFARPVAPDSPKAPVCPIWLPKKQTEREHVPRAEAVQLARDIFQRWVGHVRQSVPMAIYN